MVISRSSVKNKIVKYDSCFSNNPLLLKGINDLKPLFPCFFFFRKNPDSEPKLRPKFLRFQKFMQQITEWENG